MGLENDPTLEGSGGGGIALVCVQVDIARKASTPGMG